MSFAEVSTRQRCRICEKPDWCKYDEESGVSICRRISGGIHRTDKAGAEFWMYFDNDKKSSSIKNYEFIKKGFIKETPPPEHLLNEFYTAVIHELTLSKHHYESLVSKRKIPPEEVERRQYRSLSNQNRKRIANILVSKFGEEKCSLIPGMYKDQNTDWRLAGCEGMLIPVRSIQGSIVAFKIRSDRQGKYFWLSSKTKGGRSPGCPLHFPLSDWKNTTVIRLTEGELKADVATVYTGIPTISIPGVGSWRKVIPPLQRMLPANVKVAFDSDFEDKKLVASSLVQLINYLKRTGFNFEVERWKTIRE